MLGHDRCALAGLGVALASCAVAMSSAADRDVGNLRAIDAAPPAAMAAPTSVRRNPDLESRSSGHARIGMSRSTVDPDRGRGECASCHSGMRVAYAPGVPYRLEGVVVSRRVPCVTTTSAAHCIERAECRGH